MSVLVAWTMVVYDGPLPDGPVPESDAPECGHAVAGFVVLDDGDELTYHVTCAHVLALNPWGPCGCVGAIFGSVEPCPFPEGLPPDIVELDGPHTTEGGK